MSKKLKNNKVDSNTTAFIFGFIFTLILIGGLVSCVVYFDSSSDDFSPSDYESSSPESQSPSPEPVIVYNEAFVLEAGNFQYWTDLSGDYTFQVTSSEGVDIDTYVSRKDLQLILAGGDGAEHYPSCSTQNSLYFNRRCNLPSGAVFVIANHNLLESISVNVKIIRWI